MGWKNWPSWLKGGIIGGVIGIIALLAIPLRSLSGDNADMLIIVAGPFVFLGLPSMFIIGTISHGNIEAGIYLAPLVYFIVGAIILMILNQRELMGK